jgi:hypothetical protein
MAGLFAADHLDSPSIANRADVDINDVYAFKGNNPANTVLAMTVSPVASATTRFGTANMTRYVIRIDTNGNGVEDIAYVAEFRNERDDDDDDDDDDDRGNADQTVTIERVTGRAARSLTPSGKVVGRGDINEVIDLKGGGRFFAGLRSDPFFFDLAAFRDDVEQGNLGVAPDLGDGVGTDFFTDLNTLAIVLEVKAKDLGQNIGVWATTSARNSNGKWVQADRMGRPAINTVINSTGAVIGGLGGCTGSKTTYNASRPVNDPADFVDEAACALTVLSSLDNEGSYSAAQLGVLASVLLPDILPFHRTGPVSQLPAPLNGRALADDVIDVELRVVTGGDPLGLFGGSRDADGGINTDAVGPHADYLDQFPYLGGPHS